MSILSKTTITPIALGASVHPDIANQPHLDLEANIDDIISFINSGGGAMYAYDDTASSGLVFEYTAGKYTRKSQVVSTPQGNVTLTASTTNFIEIDLVGAVVISPTQSYTKGLFPLYRVTTDATSVVTVSDDRSLFSNQNFIHTDDELNIGDNLILSFDPTTKGKIESIDDLVVVVSTASANITLKGHNQNDDVRTVANFGGDGVEIFDDGVLRINTSSNGGFLHGLWEVSNGLTVRSDTTPIITIQLDTIDGIPHLSLADHNDNLRGAFFMNSVNGDVAIQRLSAGGDVEAQFTLTSDGNLRNSQSNIQPSTPDDLVTQGYVSTLISTSGDGLAYAIVFGS